MSNENCIWPAEQLESASLHFIEDTCPLGKEILGSTTVAKTSSRSQKGREIRNNSQMPQEKYFLQLSADTRPHWPRLACDLQQTLQEVTTLPFPSELPPRKPRVQPPRLNLHHLPLLHLPLTPEPVFRHHPRAVVRDRRRSSHCGRYLSNHTATIYKLMKRSIKNSLKYHFILY